MTLYQKIISVFGLLQESIGLRAARTELAPLFDDSAAYTPGRLVVYENVLYRCVSNHSGAWDASHFTKTTVAEALGRGDGVTLDDEVTEGSSNGVKSSGIFSFVDGTKANLLSEIAVTKAASVQQLANNKIAVVNGSAGGEIMVSVASHSNGLRRCHLLVTDVASDNAVTVGMKSASYIAIGVISTSKGNNLYTFQEYEAGKWIVIKEGAASGGGSGPSGVLYLNSQGELVTSEDSLNNDGTVTADGTLNDDGTYTVVV